MKYHLDAMDDREYQVIYETGALGGFVAGEHSLAQDGQCQVFDLASITDQARVCGDAIVCNNAIVADKAVISGRAIVTDHACVCGNAVVTDQARIIGYGKVYGDARICDDAVVMGTVCGTCIVKGDVAILPGAYLPLSGELDCPLDYRVVSLSFLEPDLYATYDYRHNTWCVDWGCEPYIGASLESFSNRIQCHWTQRDTCKAINDLVCAPKEKDNWEHWRNGYKSGLKRA